MGEVWCGRCNIRVWCGGCSMGERCGAEGNMRERCGGYNIREVWCNMKLYEACILHRLNDSICESSNVI